MSEISFPFDNPAHQKFLQIDSEGYFVLNGVRATDKGFGSQLLNSMVRDQSNRFFVQSNDVWACVEPFDEPYIAEMVQKSDAAEWSVLLPYGVEKTFSLDTLSLDEWDRFHGRCENGVPFVMTRKAQAEFFDLVDEFDDESITVNGQRYSIPTWLLDNTDALDEQFWTQIYQTEPTPGFDLGEPTKALPSICAQLKLNKMRVAVLGAGKGHDAAFFAQQGHLVTAFDISPEAIKYGEQHYGQLDNLKFELMDVLQPKAEFFHQFDLVFEHTCYCAIPPSRRNDMVKAWKQLLAEDGHVLGVFFAMDKRFGPPYGGSEWELQQRFKNDFDFTYWTRWRASIERRLGWELIIYMQKKGATVK